MVCNVFTMLWHNVRPWKTNMLLTRPLYACVKCNMQPVTCTTTIGSITYGLQVFHKHAHNTVSGVLTSNHWLLQQRDVLNHGSHIKGSRYSVRYKFDVCPNMPMHSYRWEEEYEKTNERRDDEQCNWAVQLHEAKGCWVFYSPSAAANLMTFLEWEAIHFEQLQQKHSRFKDKQLLGKQQTCDGG